MMTVKETTLLKKTAKGIELNTQLNKHIFA